MHQNILEGKLLSIRDVLRCSLQFIDNVFDVLHSLWFAMAIASSVRAVVRPLGALKELLCVSVEVSLSLCGSCMEGPMEAAHTRNTILTPERNNDGKPLW